MNISSLFGFSPISFYPQLREITGSIPAAIMLQQLLYWWSRRKGDTVFKTEADMQAETSLTPAEQKSAIKALREAGFITVQRNGVPPKRHFTVNEEAINEALYALINSVKSAELNRRNPPNQTGEIRRNNTENTAEITSENTTYISPPIYSPTSKKPKKETPRQVLEHVLSPEDTDAVIEHRQRLRKPLTQRAAKILANAFSEIPPEKRSEAVDMMIVSGWTGFKAEWFNNRQQQSASTSCSLPSEMLAEKIMEMSNGSNTHTLLALAKWAMARRGYALSKDWKSVLVEIDTIAKGLEAGGEYVDEIMALAIEDLTNGDEGAKLNSDMIKRRYNDMLKAVRGSTKFVYDEDGSGHFETILSRESEELRRRISERFGNIPLLEDKR